MKTSAKHFGLVVGPRPGNMSQNDLKTTSLMTSVTKNPLFFQVQSTRVANPFEPLNSSQLSSTIGRGARALVRQPKTAVF